MKRAFFFLAFFTLNIVMIISACVYLLIQEDIENAKRQATVAIVKAVSLAIQSKFDQLNQTLDQIGQAPELIRAAESNNSQQLQRILDQYQKAIPGVKSLRLVTPDTATIDESREPHMGYADLELIRATFTKNQSPLVQGPKGPQRHLAIARKVELSNQQPAALLASMDYRFLNKVLAGSGLNNGLMQLKQGTLTLANTGNQNLLQSKDKNDLKILNTKLSIEYWYPEVNHFDQLFTLIGIIASLMLLLLLGFFYTYRKISEIIQLDQSSVLLAVKDMIANQLHGNYPVYLDETKAIIASIRQYKRIMEQDENKEDLPDADDELNLDDLFDEESENPDLEISQEPDHQRAEFDIIDPETNEAIKVKASSKPITLPSDDDSDESELDEPNQAGSTTPKLSKPEEGFEIFRAYDIRGIVDQSLSKEMVESIGRALGSEMVAIGRTTLVVARDGRNSSPMLTEALIQGVISTGTEVIDLGMVPTPVLYFVVHHHTDHSGVMITGSHNPADYNGLKMVLDGETLSGDRIQDLAERIRNKDFIQDQLGEVTPNQLFRTEYIGAISDEIHLARPIKVVVDCGNGVAGEMAPTLLRTLGCEVIELFCDIDGDFPNHHPDPSNPNNLKDLQAAVKYYQADLGLAFDGDGDRLGVLDNQGRIIWPDRQMMLYAKDVLKRFPASDIIFDVKCTHLLASQITKFGGRPVMYKTGHSFMKAKIKQSNAKLAGEMSGHIFFNDRWFGFDDALYTAARLIEILSADSQDSQEVFADFPDSINTPELNVLLEEGENHGVVDQLIRSANFPEGKISTIDGLRVDFNDGWGLVRASNTTPSLVMRFDADNQAALTRIQKQFKELISTIKPNLDLPF